MKVNTHFLLFVFSAVFWWPQVLVCQKPGNRVYSWLDRYEPTHSLAARIALPDGYRRVEVARGSFADWLRNLPLKPGNPEVYLYDGRKKGNQEAHFAVIDIDTGKRDLQQCADAVMRLRAEYFYARNQFPRIHFNFTSGDTATFSAWSAGQRPKFGQNRVQWRKTASESTSYATFRKYLDTVFIYAGTYSLKKELKTVPPARIKIGDVFIQGGFPGHAVLVVDMAVNAATGEKIFLLAQSYMPAQHMHILKNPAKPALSPWYEVKETGDLDTPEWRFQMSDLSGFRE